MLGHGCKKEAELQISAVAFGNARLSLRAIGKMWHTSCKIIYLGRIYMFKKVVTSLGVLLLTGSFAFAAQNSGQQPSNSGATTPTTSAKTQTTKQTANHTKKRRKHHKKAASTATQPAANQPATQPATTQPAK
jgi:hypothetical protein